MPYVLRMSTDSYVLNLKLASGWDSPESQVESGKMLPNGAVIVMIGHGTLDNKKIGSKDGRTLYDGGECFNLISSILTPNAVPGAIYIWTCQKHVPGFAAHIALAAEKQRKWRGMWLYGTDSSESGPVPKRDWVGWIGVQVS